MANSRFSLNDYFTHIGLPGYQPKPTLGCLREITFQHLITFPYESSRLFQEGKKPAKQRQVASLDPDIIFDEMVNKKMPAYCYQNNGLLYAVLTRIGFDVSRHLSKVILESRDKVNVDTAATLNVTHLTLTVKIKGQDYMVDTGFSNESLRKPLPLIDGAHKLGSDDYLLEEFDDHWLLNSRRFTRNDKQYWFSLFRFDKKAVNDIEINKSHHDLYHAKNIPIRTDLLLYSTVSDRKRKFVYWSATEKCGLFRSIKNNGTIRDTKEFDSEAATIAFAKQKFSL
jgi:N-hydroxyarylamine O-acetyltransferase